MISRAAGSGTDSELAMANAAAGGEVAVSQLFAEALEVALGCSRDRWPGRPHSRYQPARRRIRPTFALVRGASPGHSTTASCAQEALAEVGLDVRAVSSSCRPGSSSTWRDRKGVRRRPCGTNDRGNHRQWHARRRSVVTSPSPAPRRQGAGASGSPTTTALRSTTQPAGTDHDGRAGHVQHVHPLLADQPSVRHITSSTGSGSTGRCTLAHGVRRGALVRRRQRREHGRVSSRQPRRDWLTTRGLHARLASGEGAVVLSRVAGGLTR